MRWTAAIVSRLDQIEPLLFAIAPDLGIQNPVRDPSLSVRVAPPGAAHREAGRFPPRLANVATRASPVRGRCAWRVGEPRSA